MEWLVEAISKYYELVTTGFGVITAVVGFISGKKWQYVKKGIQRKSLKLDNDRKCRIAIPIYKDILLHPNARNPKTKDVSEKNDLLASIDVVSAIRKLDIELDNEYLLKQEENVCADDNLFCIGGPGSNVFTRSYFSTFLSEFRIYHPRVIEDENERKEWEKLYYTDEKKRGFRWGDGKEFTVDEGENYAIIARLTPEDLDIEGAGTVYILYGNENESTKIVANYFLKHIDDLIKRTRGKKHFFLVMKTSEKGVFRFDENSDLTDEIFCKDRRKGDN